MYQEIMHSAELVAVMMLNNNQKDLIDDTCDYVQNTMALQEDNCECGFDEEDNAFPTNPMFAQSYVPWQTMDRTFLPSVGLKMETIFPELVKSIYARTINGRN